MSTLYLVDMFANPVSTAPITDVREGPTAPMAGNFVIRVPDNISVQNPATVADLLNAKMAGIFAFFAGFSTVTYDPLLDLTHVDTAAVNVGGYFGDRNAIAILPAKKFQSLMVPLVGSAPAQAYITFEAYSVQTDDGKTTRVQPTYVEEPASSFDCEVSFNNGVTWNSMIDGALLNIPLIDRGTEAIVRFLNTTGGTIRLGSWALIY